ncbi:MAG: MFS transporter [Pseudomonadota bacterium]
MTPRWFYGWSMVGAVFAVLFLIFGAAYSFSAVFPALATEFNASRGAVSLVFSIGAFLYFAIGIGAGPLADRFGPRWVVGFGIAIVAVGLVIAALAEDLWQVYAGYGLGIGIGVGFAYVPAVAALQRWFVRHRGFASGLAITGIGLGTLVAPPAAAWLIEQSGWRATYVAFAMLVAIIGLGAAWLLEPSPAERGLHPDGDPAPAVTAGAPDASLSLREALRTRPFWLFYVATVILSLGLFVPFVHLVPYALDHGLSAKVGALLVGTIGVGSTIGRFVIGAIADRFGRLPVLVGCYASLGVMFLLWLSSANPIVLGIFGLGFGTFYGGFVALAPAVTADYFGVRALGGILGALYSSVGIGTLIGPTLAGYAFDVYGSYTVPIVAGVITSFVGAALAFMMPAPEQWRANYFENHR